MDLLAGMGVSDARAAAPAAGDGPRRGRPRGSKNKRSGDLGAIVAHTYGGRTPGQQLATVCMVTPREVRQAKPRAKDVGISPELMAMVIKAENLAKAMGWPGAQGVRDAWSMMFKAYSELLPYIHQRLPQAEPPKQAAALPMIVLADGLDADAPSPMIDVGEGEEDQALSELVPLQLTQSNSHD